MSKETDAIVARHKASGVGGRVTSITSSAPGRKDGTYHQRWGTPSAKDKAGKGLAVDFGDDTGDAATPTKLAIFKLFAQESPKLAELFYSHAPYFVKHGVKKPISQFNREDFARHKNHVHVAVSKGVSLTVPTPTLSAASSKEPPMSKPVFIDACSTPDLGGSWRLEPNGGVWTHGNAQFFGAFANLPENIKLTSTGVFIAIETVPSTGGYRIFDTSGNFFDFNQRVYEELKAKGLIK
ncbi:hypothetical protein [Kocuria rosea]|uniref:hypothetical protein n=1 Tax=Kocuria rosea TaxID=1275 RepID=UPI0011AA2C1F|nr:hypothetical protein [Kocuria rosea]